MKKNGIRSTERNLRLADKMYNLGYKNLIRADKQYMKEDKIRQKIKDVISSGPLSNRKKKKISRMENRADTKNLNARGFLSMSDRNYLDANSLSMGTLKGRSLNYNPKSRTTS
jgi:hypothetical protein